MTNQNDDDLAIEIKTLLRGCVGSERVYMHFTGLVCYSEGVKCLAETADAYWLIDAIASFQLIPEIVGNEMLREHQYWCLSINADKSATLILKEGVASKEVAYSYDFRHVDLPFKLGKLEFFVGDRVLMLPQEN